MAANRDVLAGKRLDSWKEIAAFFGRAERTVKRWETERGLPVHRVPGTGRSSVFAYSDELADWLKGRSQELAADEPSSDEIAEPDAVAPEVSPAARPGLSTARVAAWVVPLALAGALVVFLSLGHQTSRFKALAGRHAPDAEAQELYLKGRYYWDRRTPEDLYKAIDFFTQAIVKDPSDAAAYVGLADCYNLLREFGAMPAGEAYPRALSAAQRAVELDNSSAEAHNSLAFVTYWWSWQGATAEREFKRAIELDPNLVRAHHWYATFLLAQNRHAEALDQIEQAQRLEPSSTSILADKGFALWCAGRQSEGLALLKQLETSQPSLSSTHYYLGRIYWEQQKDYGKALAEWRQLAELRHDQPGIAIANARESGFAAGGLAGLWRSELPIQKDQVDNGSGSAYELAATYAALGQRQEAITYLKIAFDHREADMLTDTPPIPALRDDAEYRELRARVQELLAQ
jgi:tetratricopeptide (TPR) repeat protein